MNASRTELDLLVEARHAVRSGRAARVRRAAALSQGELAAAVGVTASAISRWETGSRLPQAEPAVAYARTLRRLERAAVQNDERLASTPGVATTSPEDDGRYERRL
jgi:transcriptional regulator with XRE-family HTH domain